MGVLATEIERLRKNLQAEEKNLEKNFHDECNQLEATMQSELEKEKIYIENCTEIEIGKLKEEIEAKIEELYKNRYKNLENEMLVNEPKLMSNEKELVSAQTKPLSMEMIEIELQKDREQFRKEAKERRERFDEQMKMFFKFEDPKRIEFLKKNIVPLVNAAEIKRITDESTLETRYDLKINRNAIRLGPSWALYKATYQDQSVVCRISVVAKLPTEIRFDFFFAGSILKALFNL